MYDTGSSGQAGVTGKVTGEGSHFGTGGTGTDSAGYSLGKNTSGHGFSAAEPTVNTDSSGYAIGKGPEALGHREEGNHINTAAERETRGDEYPGGQAAIGQTSTYSSHPLSSGDQTSSVVDPTSSDPNTFKKPETSTTGVSSDGAEIAARKAMDPESRHMPGGYPSEDSSNPYVSSHLDPRVDSAGHASSQSHTGRDTALGAGAGAVGLGAYEAAKHDEPKSTSTTSPATLTSTIDPTERSPTYGSGNQSQSLDSPTGTTTTTSEDSTQKKSMVGTVLGALGLGGGAAAAKHEHDKDSAVDSTPSTTTGVGSYRSPSQSGPPPAHHRKESIPTTAYPAGNLDSVRPIAGPTGQASSDQNYGRDAALVGGVAGAGALGTHEYESHRSEQPAGMTGTTSGPTGTSTFEPGMAGTNAAAPNASTIHDRVTGDSLPSSQATGVTSGAGTTGVVGDDSSHHYGRDAAVGGGALAATGLAAHEYEKGESATDSTAQGVTPTSQQYGNQPIAGTQGTQSFSDKVDPRINDSGNANKGTGVAGIPITASDQPEEQHHYGRDAAVVGGGGAAAAGYGAHEISEHDAEKAEKERTKLQKSQTKEMEKREKAQEKELKKEQKAEVKAEKKHEKAVAKEEKKQEKEQAKEEKKHEKEVAKAEKEQAKAAEKEESRHEKEGAAAVGAGAVGAGGAYEYEKHQQPSTGTGRLSTDPSLDPTVGKPSASAGEDTEHHYGRDAALGGAGAGALGAGVYEAEKHHKSSTTGAQDPYYTRHPVPDSAVQGEPTVPTTAGPSHGELGEDQHHYGRDAALGGAGAGALGAGAYEAEKHHESSTTGAQNPYYTRHPVPDSAVQGEPTVPTTAGPSHGELGEDQHHYGRDAAVGGVGAAAVGGAAYEAEQPRHEQDTSTTTGHGPSGLTAADEHDSKAHGREEKEKKPSLFKRIFKRKKNEHTGEEEDDPNDYEDVPHDHPHGTNLGAGVGTTGIGSPHGPTTTDSPSSSAHQHVEGEMAKPSYNPFKKEVASDYKAVEGRI